ncbi:MAG: lycopene cyclase domain-containing protein [Rhodoglobus sp.]|jgi:lycopene cyclase domain-containing protein|nr:lycopene cyclase domain-containing protein [Rhodoglobus sp.]
MTYWLLNAVFLAPVIVVAVLAARRVRWAAIGLTAALLLVMTAVFDNIMIGVGLVDYDPRFISGVFIGVAPLEDFAYALAAIVGLPSVWHLLAPRATSLVEPPLLVEPVETHPVETDPR